MSAKAFAIVAASLLPLLGTVGCSSHHDNSAPYGMTGSADTAAERARWTDEKNKYRPEWRNGINTPHNVPNQGAVTP